MRKRVVILGAGGRDFHNFNVYFRDNPEYEVVAFTATQIPGIEGRVYPPKLAGKLYPNGIPILPESDLPKIIREYDVDFVVFSYSDVSHQHVMNLAAISLANGASFLLLGPKDTMLESEKPVIAVGAVRTGCGKSTLSRKIVRILLKYRIKVAVIRHPMAYGDLERQAVQKFETFEDLDRYEATIEEREEYEHYLEMGLPVYAGVDYEKILKEAEKDADLILWDGGNNDYPFIKPDIFFVVADALRPGHELTYWPGSVNVRMADVIIINKVVEASMEQIKRIEENIRMVNPKAKVLLAASILIVDKPELIKEKRVLVIEDGPTVLHGEMPWAAGYIAAIRYGAKEIVDPRKYVEEEPDTDLYKAYKEYKHLGPVLPTLGYSRKEIAELERIINRIEADSIVLGTPSDITKYMKINKPVVRVKYELEELGRPKIEDIITDFLKKKGLI